MIKRPIEDLLSIISQGRPLRREIVHVSLAKQLDSFFTYFENSDSICPQVFRSYTSPYDSKKNINITTKQQMASGSKLTMQMNKKIIFLKKKSTFNQDTQKKSLSASSCKLELPGFQFSHSKCLYSLPWPPIFPLTPPKRKHQIYLNPSKPTD